MASRQQLAANRANAQLSSGPTSSEGKVKVSHNALKTGRTVLLPYEDVEVYQQHVERIFKRFTPENDEEKRLTQSLADTLWRLERIPSLEAGIYAIGRRELAAQFTDEEDEAELKRLLAGREQAAKDRETAENRRWQNAIDHYRTAQEDGMPLDPAEIGFDFSTEEIAARERQQELKGAIDGGRYYEYKKKGYLNLPGKAA